MIYCPELDKSFEDTESMLIELKDNITKVVAEKKASFKKADGYAIVKVVGSSAAVIERIKEYSVKAMNPLIKAEDFVKEMNLPKLNVTSVANTTNWFDSHRDVHIDGLWKKTLADIKGVSEHLQEHKEGFAHIIDDAAKVFVKQTTFKELGFNYEGTTQALMGKSAIDMNRNAFMYVQYANKWVKNHSVGMRYVRLLYCANSDAEDMKEFKKNWDKYYPVIANKDDVDACQYFFAVLEAKLCEYSAVAHGSNIVTPTEDIEFEAEESPESEEKTETADDTLHEDDQTAAQKWDAFKNRN